MKQYIVAADGTISQVKAISGPTTGGLLEMTAMSKASKRFRSPSNSPGNDQ